VELDATAAIITYEEYYPYGSTSLQSGRSAAEVSLKRYRFAGQQRDEESGFYCMGARYYASWLGRWTSCDPQGMVDGPNVYGYARGNPVILTDPKGTCSSSTDYANPALKQMTQGKPGGDGGDGGGGERSVISLDAVGRGLASGWESFKKAMGSAWKGIAGAFSSAWDTFKKAASAAWDGIKNALSSAWKWVKETASQVPGWVKGAAGTALQGVRTVLGKLVGILINLTLGPLLIIVGGLIHAVVSLIEGSGPTVKEGVSRGLTEQEKTTLRGVFGDSVDLDKVTVKREGIAALGAPRTVANTISLKQDGDWQHFQGDSLDLTKRGTKTLVHEMTHVWQYQHGGLGYMTESLGVQLEATISSGDRDGAYDWKDNVDKGVPWEQWNPEQQAKAVEDKYAFDHDIPVYGDGHWLTPAERTDYSAKLAPYTAKVHGR
jgi:RHS repeat-associated protein